MKDAGWGRALDRATRTPHVVLAGLAIAATFLAFAGGCSSGTSDSSADLGRELVSALEARDHAEIANLAVPHWVDAEQDVADTFATRSGTELTNWCFAISPDFPDAQGIFLYADAVTDGRAEPWSERISAYRIDGSWWAGFGTPREPGNIDNASTQVRPDGTTPTTTAIPARPADCSVA